MEFKLFPFHICNSLLLERTWLRLFSHVYLFGCSSWCITTLIFTTPPPMCGHPSLPAWSLTPYSRLPSHVATLHTNCGSNFSHPAAHPYSCSPDPSRSLQEYTSLPAQALISHIGCLTQTPSSPLGSDTSCHTTPIQYMGILFTLLGV